MQCNSIVPDNLKPTFSNFPPIFKKIDVCRKNFGEYKKNYDEENDLLENPQRKLISSFKLKIGTIITTLLNFCLSLGLQCTKKYRFVEYTLEKCFDIFFQFVVDARREGDENPHSGVVAETMKLFGNRSYGYQSMDRSRHTTTKYLGDEKTHEAMNAKFFKRLEVVKKDLNEKKIIEVNN